MPKYRTVFTIYEVKDGEEDEKVASIGATTPNDDYANFTAAVPDLYMLLDEQWMRLSERSDWVDQPPGEPPPEPSKE